ncbi:MAG: citrate (Si)-synthase [Chloroflexi bacterium]|nr:citrate (Si)-synthase [Chloroflexota bacterium]
MVEKADVGLHRGLRDVYLDTSQASYIDGENGVLLYRGYNIHDLAEKSTFPEVVYLLLHGELPTRSQLAALEEELRIARPVPPEVLEIVRIVRKAHPMDVLRTAVSGLAAFDPDTDDNSQEAILRKGVRLTSQMATIVAAHHRIRRGDLPVPPRDDLGHTANFLSMLFGRVPDEQTAELMDVDFILHAEHGANASAFAARVTASTLADLHAAIVSAIGTLKGPLHGGAAEHVMRMAEEIGTPDRAEEFARRIINGGGRIMGFGHRVYHVEDPRARHLRERSKALGERLGEPRWYRILSHLEQQVMAPYQRRGIYVNVDFYSGSIYNLLGIPQDLFISLFALGRVPGWTLQVLEQVQRNILIRPLLAYDGPPERPYVPLEERG